MSPTYSPPNPKVSALWRNIFSQGSRTNNSPVLTLTGGIEPGQCWAFQGNSRQLRIWLSQAIQVHALTVGHTSLSSVISTPKNITLWGLKLADSDFCTSLGTRAHLIEKTSVPGIVVFTLSLVFTSLPSPLHIRTLQSWTPYLLITLIT
jgi:hypothetical protein